MDAKTPEFEFIRIIDAPQSRVFKAWTDQKEIVQWWGPRGFTNPVCEIDVRPGGAINIHMRGPDGTVYPMGGRYEKIEAPSLLVFTGSALDLKGKPLFKQLSVISLSEQGSKTKLMVHLSYSQVKEGAAQHLAGAKIGWNQMLDKFEEYLAKGQDRTGNRKAGRVE